MPGYLPRQPPPPRGGLIALIVLASLALIAGVTCIVLITRPDSGPEASAPGVPDSPTRGERSSPETSAPSGQQSPTGYEPSNPGPSKTYDMVPDTGGPARGQAETFSNLLRARGLVCSDEKLAKVFSRGCYLRIVGSAAIRVEFIGPVNGDLGEVTINVNTSLASAEQAEAAPAFDELVERLYVPVVGG